MQESKIKGLINLLSWIRVVGFSQSVAALRYTVEKERMESRSRRKQLSSGRSIEPGAVKSTAMIPGGIRVYYENAEQEVLFLLDDLVRISWSPGTPPIPYALEDREWPIVDLEREESTDSWQLRSSGLTVAGDNTGTLQITDIDGQVQRSDAPPWRMDQQWHHSTLFPDEYAAYGLGERAHRLNLRGGRFRLWNQDPGGRYQPGDDPLNLSIPVYVLLHENGSHLIFYENFHDGWIDFLKSPHAEFMEGMLRYYFIPGPPAHALERYTLLTGRHELPPIWALGFHQSRWGYQSQADIRSVIDGFKEHDLPLDVVHMDIDYMNGFRVFTIHPNRYPDLPALADEAKREDIHLVAILNPGVKVDRDYPLYQDGLREGIFVTLPNGAPLRAPVWPGWVHFPDFTMPKARNWWGTHYPSLLDMGISGIWHDMNEPCAFTAWGDPTLPLPSRHVLESQGGDHRSAHNVFGLLMNRAGYNALRELCPGSRPFILSRSGWAGNQRYAWNWTGDTQSSWEMVRQSVATTLGLGLCGIAYTGSDIGGYYGEPSEELFLRWFQMAMFTPFFRSHAAKVSSKREPWRYSGAILDSIRDMLRLRHRLMPYIYTLAWLVAETGQPIIRPLFWEDPRDPALWDIEDRYLFGPDLLVAPVMEEGVREMEIPLPPGEWVDFWDDRRYSGGGTVLVPAPMDRIPLFIRGGAILPTMDGSSICLNIYPPSSGSHQSILYRDAGDGYGDYRLETFQLKRVKNTLELEREVQGGYEISDDEFLVRIHGFEVLTSETDGELTDLRSGSLKIGPFNRLFIRLKS